ncbi:hypothetical protein [Metabacillus rhizolycopersici]|uniref:Uncharacterized protein n=1 Tax=Metabacillus rhizolycopersici TaxID=2875709 RepID=A0ABS7UTJ8_9BACI|nr:hypothetical protein [Metabacillus rhizolycopersici]MBZ5751338.1 hypothetical protein [Metabacillus rhizolycopersici]
MVYRPTVRYADEFKKYVDDLFHATDLDRNQIIRAALFSAASSPAFASIINQHKGKDVTLPSASWSVDHHWLWMEQNPSKQGGDKDVNVNILGEDVIEKATESVVGSSITSDRCEQSIERREGKVLSDRYVFRNQGGISIKIG